MRTGNPDEFLQRIEVITNRYRESVSTPLPTHARLFNHGDKFGAASQWTFTDLDMTKRVVFEGTHVWSPHEETFRNVTYPTEVNPAIIFSSTSHGKNPIRAIFKEVNRGDKKEEYVEFWKGSERLGLYDVENVSQHGNTLTKGFLGTAAWSSDERKFMFVAEKKVPKPESFFSQKPNAECDIGGQYRFKDDWGEQHEGSVSPVIVIVEIATLKSTVIEKDGFSLGQPIFTPKDKGVVFVGMEEKPYRLGAVFCVNRHTQLFHYDLTSKVMSRIGETGKCLFTPTFDPTGKHLLYFRNEVGGPHQMAAELLKLVWNPSCFAKKGTVIVPVPENPREHEFPGLYDPKVPLEAFSKNGDHFFVNSIWHSKDVILKINIETGEILNVTTDEKFGSWELLSMIDNNLLARRSSPSMVTHLAFGKLTAKGSVEWTPVGHVSKVRDVHWEILKLRPTLHPEQYFEAIYVRRNHPHPLVLYPHGGPHAADTAQYIRVVRFFLDNGYGVLLVNYRGSLGFGEKNLRSLPGNVGNFDVKDCIQAVEAVRARGLVNDVFVFGGSHGGFVAAHLAGQYPSYFKAFSLLNPVVDMSLMGPSDIPDWYWFESGCEKAFKYNCLPSDQDMAKMRSVSPVVHAHKIKDPCLFGVGSNDLRVDKAQGLRLYKYLLAQGVETKCHMYRDNHSLSQIPHSSDFIIHTVNWFYDHRDKKNITNLNGIYY